MLSVMEEPKTKVCNDCGLEYDIDDFYLVYYKSRGKRYRLGHCRYCDNRRHRADYQKHREKRLAAKKAAFNRDPWVIRLRAITKRCDVGYITVGDLKTLVEEAQDTCVYCNGQLNGNWTFDHATPVSKGGTNDPENLRVCCLSCNSAKGAMDEAEFRIKLYGAPF